MLLVTPILIFAYTGVRVDATVLDYHAGVFSLTQGKVSTRIPVTATPAKSPSSVSFRKDDNYVVWDSRGLTIRHGNRSSTTLLEETPTSPRLFEHAILLQTVADLKSGKKQRPASALSGALRIGGDVFLLVRWDDKAGKPWMEALVRVALAGVSLKPEVLGRFDAMSIAYKPIDDRLTVIGGRLGIVARQGKTWGLASFDSTASKFDFHPLGDDLISYLSTSPKTGFFFEKTVYGTTVGGRVDLASGYRKTTFESRGAARFLDSSLPPIILSSRDQDSRIRYVDSGAEIAVPFGSGVARAGSSILVWSPAAKPTSATLYDPERWFARAKWTLAP